MRFLILFIGECIPTLTVGSQELAMMTERYACGAASPQPGGELLEEIEYEGDIAFGVT